MDDKSKIDLIKEKVSRTSLYIGRIPDKTKTEFKEYAQEEFEGDYGMALKWLMDFKKGLLSDPNQILNDKIDIIAEEVKKLQDKEKETGIKTISGKRIGGMKNEQTKSVAG